MKSFLRIGAFCLLAAAITGMPLQLLAQTTTNKTSTSTKTSTSGSSPETTRKKGKSIPFEGDISAVDKSAKTLKVGKRVFEITSDTKLFKNDKHASLDDAVVGEYVTGSYRKTSDDKLVAHNVYFGGKNKDKADKKKDK